jgi:hypothetical protein
MTELYRTTNILGMGTYAVHFENGLWGAFAELKAIHTILTYGRSDFNRGTASAPTAYGQDGVRDVSPHPSEILNAIGFAGSDEIARINRDLWEHVVHAMISKVVQAHSDANLRDGQTLWFQGMKTGHGQPAGAGLSDLKTRLPRNFVVVQSVISDDQDRREMAATGYDLFCGLKEQGIIESTWLLDNQSPFALAFNLEVQDRFHAKAVASVIAAQGQFSRNPSLAEVGRSLGRRSAFAGLAFASRSLVVKEVRGWSKLREATQKLAGNATLPVRGYGDVTNVILEAKEATKHAIKNREAHAIDEEIDLGQQFFVVYTIPMSVRQTSAWGTIGGEIRRWLANDYPTATPIFASGPGTPDPRFSGSYWLQVSVLYPIPDVPAPIAQILARHSSGGALAATGANGSQPGERISADGLAPNLAGR